MSLDTCARNDCHNLIVVGANRGPKRKFCHQPCKTQEGYVRQYWHDSRQNEKRQARRYGVDPQELYLKQDGRCAICSEPFGESSPCVDHDHNCCPDRLKSCGKCVRGLLCNPCNKGIGFFNDNPARLLEAAKYLSALGGK